MMLLCLSASSSRYRCSRDAELQAESGLAAAPFSWEGAKRTWAPTVAPETALGTGSETLFSSLRTRLILCHQSPCFNTACAWRQCRKPAQLVASAPVRQRGRVAPRFVICPSHYSLFGGLSRLIRLLSQPQMCQLLGAACVARLFREAAPSQAGMGALGTGEGSNPECPATAASSSSL